MLKHGTYFIVATLIALLSAFAAPAALAQGYEIAVYVDETRNSSLSAGHVFITLSDGKKTFYSGFYPLAMSAAALSAMGDPKPGHLQPDDDRHWDVKHVYRIDTDAYHKAFEVIIEWNKSPQLWGPKHNCVDFAVTVLNAAGVELPWNRSDDNHRPKKFGRFLRENGGIAHYPFEGDWIVEEGTQGIPKSIAIDHSDIDGDYKLCANFPEGEHEYLFKRIGTSSGSGISIQWQKEITSAEMPSAYPDIPEECRREAYGKVSNRQKITLADDGLHIHWIQTLDKINCQRLIDPRTKNVVKITSGVEEGKIIRNEATLHLEIPKEPLVLRLLRR